MKWITISYNNTNDNSIERIKEKFDLLIVIAFFAIIFRKSRQKSDLEIIIIDKC